MPLRHTTITLDKQTQINLGHLKLDWYKEYDLPIEPKVSHCLNAAIDVIIEASNSELIEKEAQEKNLSKEHKADLEANCQFFIERFLEKLKTNMENRMGIDKRKIKELNNDETDLD